MTASPRLLLPLVLAATFAFLTGCASNQAAQQPASIAAAAAAEPALGTFHRLVQQAGLQATLEGAGPLTVFAPSDEAFKAVPAATLDKLSRAPEFLKAVLQHHIVPGALKSADIDGSKMLTTVGGSKLNVSKAGDFVTVDDGLVTKADVAATNGLIHVVDSVLMPPKK